MDANERKFLKVKTIFICVHLWTKYFFRKASAPRQ